jgi:hypothetical protein
VSVTLFAEGRDSALLHSRRAGEAWQARPVSLTAGRGEVVLGPLDADLSLVAESGRRRSDTVRVTLRPSLFVADLALTARYPTYVNRPSEPVGVGDTVRLPVGTVLRATGRASLPLAHAAWTSGETRVPLTVDRASLDGLLTVRRSATWTLTLAGEDGIPLDGAPPSVTVEAIPDRAPEVVLVVPSADTLMPTTLLQPLVIEVRDDYRVTGLEVQSRRVSRLGTVGGPVGDSVGLPPEGVERGVVTAQLDLNGRGYLPGDTAYVRVRARDNAPRSRTTETAEIRLRLPSLAELRASVREDTRALSATADSLADAQRDVGRAVEDLAHQRQRDPTGARGQGRSRLEFEQAERAGTLGAEQRAVLERATELRDRLNALDRTAWEAGLADPEFHRQLAELRELLNRALSPELQAALEQLERAMEQLDPEAMRDALERLADAQAQLQTELEQNRTLLERAALEGDLTTLAEDAAELARRQDEWNQLAERSVDSASAAAEERLAANADSLASRLADAEGEMADAGVDTTGSSSANQAEMAAQQMRRAAQAAAASQQARAAQAGARASEQLDPLAEALTEQRDAMREAWRQEVTAALDAALLETAQLARSQEDVLQRLGRGESGAEVRAAQGAARDGLDQVLERVRDASGKNALVAPTLSMALGYARNRMGEALTELQQGIPNTRAAGAAAGEALDGLNTLAMQLLRSRGDVSGAESGSGLSEAVERMAQLAERQGQMAGQAGGMLPLMQSAGQLVMEEMQALARQQRALAAELERLQAQGDQAGAGELADEAEAIARQLEQGALTRETVERQERLYRRLLDAGRTLRGPETDEQQERLATTAREGNVRLPPGTRPPAAGPRYPYPGWQELRGLSPADRRAVLEYFRRLNDARR